MSISKGEKIVIYMLAEIYKKLGIEGEIDPDFMQKMVVNGSSWAIDWQYNNMFDAEEDSAQLISETTSILTMYRDMQNSYEHLSEQDKERVRKCSIYKDDPVRFPGFDGNHDPHIGVANTLVNELGRFSELKGKNLNSHSEKISKYRKMLPIHEKAMVEADDYRLSADALCDLIEV